MEDVTNKKDNNGKRKKKDAKKKGSNRKHKLVCWNCHKPSRMKRNFCWWKKNNSPRISGQG